MRLCDIVNNIVIRKRRSLKHDVVTKIEKLILRRFGRLRWMNKIENVLEKVGVRSEKKVKMRRTIKGLKKGKCK